PSPARTLALLPRRSLRSTLFPYTTLFRSLLLREVNHRVKNQYAVILSIIRETGKRSKSIADYEARLRERIMSLSNAHDLLVLGRSEEHTSELQSRENLVCRLLLEKKKSMN